MAPLNARGAAPVRGGRRNRDGALRGRGEGRARAVEGPCPGWPLPPGLTGTTQGPDKPHPGSQSRPAAGTEAPHPVPAGLWPPLGSRLCPDPGGERGAQVPGGSALLPVPRLRARRPARCWHSGPGAGHTGLHLGAGLSSSVPLCERTSSFTVPAGPLNSYKEADAPYSCQVDLGKMCLNLVFSPFW